MRHTVVKCDRCGDEGRWDINIRSRNMQLNTAQNKENDLCDKCFGLLHSIYARFIKKQSIRHEVNNAECQ